MSIEINGAGTITGVDSLSTPAVTNAAGSASSPSITFTGDTNTGLYSPGADQVAVTTGGTARLLVDASGRLLVGTSSARSNIYSGGGAVTPTLQLENNTNTWSNGLSILNYSGSQYGASLALGMSASNTPGTNALVSTGNLCGRFHFLANDGTNFYPIAEIGGWTDGTTGTGDVPGRLTFSTTADGASSPTERMRIDSGGMFYFRSGGVTPSSSTPGSSYGYAGGYYWVNAVATTGVEYHWAFVNPNGEVGKITTNSTSTSFATTSDYRLKENVIPVTDGVARLQQLKPSRFNFIAEPSIVVDGFLAHEVQAVVPEAIVGEKDEVDADGNPVYQGIDQSKLVPLLTAALQEAIGEIESLKARIAALESA